MRPDYTARGALLSTRAARPLAGGARAAEGMPEDLGDLAPGGRFGRVEIQAAVAAGVAADHAVGDGGFDLAEEYIARRDVGEGGRVGIRQRPPGGTDHQLTEFAATDRAIGLEEERPARALVATGDPSVGG